MSELDLSPRSARASRSSRRRWAPLVVLALVLVAGGILITQFLRSAVDYYCNVDEIGQRSGCEDGRRLRVQGTVDRGTVVTDGGVTTFTISFGGASLPVRYDGQPGGIFEECQPVVVHGELANGTFEGDRIEVKHSNEYEAENSERLEDSSEDSAECSRPA